MPIQTTIQKNSLCAKYAADCTYGSVYTTAPGAAAGTEPTGGSPAFARKALAWTGTNPISSSGTFDIPSGATLVGAGLHDALTAGNYRDGTSVTSQAFASQGTYQVSYSFTES